MTQGINWYTRPGFTWNPQSGWGNPTSVAQGTPIAQNTGLPTAYDPTKDTFRSGVNGTQETALQRAMRWASDMVQNGQVPAGNYQNALNYAMANLSSDYQRGQAGQQPDWVKGTTLGWDANAFRYNDYGEKYNDQINYANPTRKYVNGQAQVVSQPPASAPVVARTVHNPDGSMTVTYADGSTKTGYPDGRPSTTTPPTVKSPEGTPPQAPAAGSPPANTTPGLANPTVAAAANTGTFTATPGALSGAQKMALGADPQQAYRWMMQQLGYNPDAPGMLGNFLQKRFQPLLEARLAASGLQNGGNDAAYLDQIDQVIQQFGQGFTQQGNGGNFFQGLQQTASDAYGASGNFLNGLKDQSQASQYLNQLASLRFAGVNPLVQQSQADQLTAANNQYQDYSFNNELQGRNIDPYQQWLMGQQKYRTICGQ